jgi:virginiamycin B lyase
MTTSGSVTQYSDNGAEGNDITTGPDGALWFSLSFQYAIGHVTTSGTVTFKPTPAINARSYSAGIATGADGAVWFSLRASAVGRMTTSGFVNECPTPTQVQGGTTLPLGMTAGPDDAMWFAENSAGKIGRIPLSSVTGLGARQRPSGRRN